MDSLQQVSLYFDELLNKSEVIDAVTPREESSWDITAINHNVGFEADYQSDEGCVTLRCYFPVPDPDKAIETFEAMLKMNWGTRDAAGLRMAVTEEGVPMQIMDIDVGSLDFDSLKAKCHFFAIRAGNWAMLLAKDGLSNGQEAAETLENMSPGAGMIRG